MPKYICNDAHRTASVAAEEFARAQRHLNIQYVSYYGARDSFVLKLQRSRFIARSEIIFV